MFISGIQQIGIGVSNVQEAFGFYRRTLGFDIPVFEEAAVAGLMLPYTGGQPQARHAILALNIQGGGGLEIWQYTGRTPQPGSFRPAPGDLGITIAKVKCKDVQACFHQLRKNGLTVRTNPVADPNGREHFYAQDPWGNVLEFVPAADWFTQDQPFQTGGVYGAVIGVSDMDKSLKFYQELLGYDHIIYDQSGAFADWQGLEGGDARYRRVLLTHKTPRAGAFSRLLGTTEIELVQSLDTPGRRIYENRFWGDLGYIHLCFDVNGMTELKARAEKMGHPFTVDSSGSFDMGEAAGYFSYVEDPDATLIEFVETHKVPIVKKLGWYLDLRRRSKPEKPLPHWMVKTMGWGRVRN